MVVCPLEVFAKHFFVVVVLSLVFHFVGLFSSMTLGKHKPCLSLSLSLKIFTCLIYSGFSLGHINLLPFKNIYLFERESHRERGRDGEKERNLPSDGSLSKWPQWLTKSKPGDWTSIRYHLPPPVQEPQYLRHLVQFSQVHEQEAGSEVQQLRHKPA